MPCIATQELRLALETELNSANIRDYCPNGLQVEGKPHIRRIVTGVTASLPLIQWAIDQEADAILVHHGVFWKSDPDTLFGFRKERMAAILAAQLNVFAYHLPLDVHPRLGNNVQLGHTLGWPTQQVLGNEGLVHFGELPVPVPLSVLCGTISSALNLPMGVHGHGPYGGVQCFGQTEPQRMVRKVAWCTGAAAGFTELAAQAGADVYLTGELSEPAVHVASEYGISLLGAGHHATERGGVLALGQWLAAQFGLDVRFKDFFVAF